MRASPAENLPTRPWPAWVAPAILAAAVVACYGNSLSGPLVLDDYSTITGNPTLTHWWEALHPPAHNALGGRPFANLTFALNRALGGDSVESYHVGNLIIHLCAALAFFGVCRRTLLRVPPSVRVGSKATPLALAIALVWAVHPVLTASVSYLSQRTESLMGLCYFLTLYAFLRSLDAGARLAWQAGSIAMCAAGMATKESMVTAPVIVAVFDWAFVAGSAAALWRDRSRYYLGLGATWLLLAALLGSGLEERQVGYGLGVTVPQYLLVEAHAILLYLKLAIWPHPLIFDYGALFSTFSAVSVAEGAAVLLLVAGAIWLLLRRPRLGFLATAFFLLLAPTSSVVPVALQPIAENRLYLPLAAVLALVVAAVWRAPRTWRYVALGAIVVGFAALTVQRNRVFQSPLTLWAGNTADRPENARGFANYALSLALAGRAPESLPVYERALQLEPRAAVNHGMYAGALLDAGRLDDAIREFRRALELDPEIVTARNNLGVALLRAGRYPKAIAHLTAAVRTHPDDVVAHQNLGLAYGATGQFDRVIAEYETVERLQPGNAEAHFAYGCYLADHGAADKSEAQFRTTLRLQPDHAGALFRLGSWSMQKGEFAEAAALLEHGLRLQPALAEASNDYGVVLFRLGRVPESIAQFERALRHRPDYEQARQNLAQAQAEAAKKK